MFLTQIVLDLHVGGKVSLYTGKTRKKMKHSLKSVEDTLMSFLHIREHNKTFLFPLTELYCTMSFKAIQAYMVHQNC